MTNTVDSQYNKPLGTEKFACYNEACLYQGYNTIQRKSEIIDN